MTGEVEEAGALAASGARSDEEVERCRGVETEGSAGGVKSASIGEARGETTEVEVMEVVSGASKEGTAFLFEKTGRLFVGSAKMGTGSASISLSGSTLTSRFSVGRDTASSTGQLCSAFSRALLLSSSSLRSFSLCSLICLIELALLRLLASKPPGGTAMFSLLTGETFLPSMDDEAE